MQIEISPDSRLTQRWVQHFTKQKLLRAARMMSPTLVALTFAGVAHAQGTMGFSGAQTLMTTFNSRFAYISVSRASHDAQIFTNAASSLATNLAYAVEKTSAIEIGSRDAPPSVTVNDIAIQLTDRSN